MAPKQGSKKKVRTVEQNKPQKKHQQARQKQKLQVEKLKKPDSHLGRKAKQTPRAKAASSELSKIFFPRLFASKLLQLMPKVEAKARLLVKAFFIILYKHVTAEIETLFQEIELPSICSDVQAFLKDAMEKGPAKHTENPTRTTRRASTPIAVA